ncbi:MAG: M20/M25/M40 family metallo-hydrolase [Candidatus Nezhaarchaeales archaeon]
MERRRVIEFVKRVCEECGPRLAGSEGERKAGEIIYRELTTFCDEVEKEYFESRPRGFLDYIWFTFSFYFAGAILYFLGYPLITALLVSLALLVFFLQQCLHYEVVDVFFPRVKEFHIIGKIKPKKEAKNLVIISAHYDSAYEFPLLGRLRMKSIYVIVPTIAIALTTMILSLIEGLLNIRDVSLVQKPLLIIGFVIILTIALTLRSNRGVLGANDDLAGVAAIIEAGRLISQDRPENTEVWVVAFAGEEHMRGSKRFVQGHCDELKKRNAIMFNVECPSADYFLICTEEKMFFAKHSSLAIEYAKKAARTIDFEVRVAPLPFAGSDAANFSRRGLHAVSIFGLSAKDNAPYHWHTMNDIPENLKPESIEKAILFAKNFVYVVDLSQR